MSKILEATAQALVVTSDGYPVPGTKIMSAGVGSSEGLLLLQDDAQYYITNTTPDLETTLSKIITALTQIASALTSLDNKPVGGSGSAPAPSVGSNVSAINAAKSELQTLVGNLK